MKTTIYHAVDLDQKEIIHHIHKVISKGGLVVFPTETVYGIGANAFNERAAAKIYQVKGRPIDNPLIVHIHEIAQLPNLVTHITPIAKKLIEAFWPGPLTMVFEKSNLISNQITAGLQTIGIRYPSSMTARNVIKAAEYPLAAPSANLSGRPSSTLFSHVFEDLNGKVDIIIDGGKSTIGLESTVLDVTTDIPTILRPGYVTKKMIEDVLKISILDLSEARLTDVPKSPGMKYTHYAPKGKFTLVEGTKEAFIQYVNQMQNQFAGHKVAVIAASEYIDQIKVEYVFDIGSILNQDEIASNLFIALREMDAQNIEHIFTHTFDDHHIGHAIMNRLLKASGYNVIKP
jgi:L-threonylcarbamoyladenylate synthase